MKDERAVLQMIRLLPLVEAIYKEARVAVSGGLGIDAADYCIARHNTYVQKIRDLTEDDLLDGLVLAPSAEMDNEQKMQHVVVAAAELQAYLRQNIGISSTSSGQIIGTLIQSPKEKTKTEE